MSRVFVKFLVGGGEEGLRFTAQKRAAVCVPCAHDSGVRGEFCVGVDGELVIRNAVETG